MLVERMCTRLSLPILASSRAHHSFVLKLCVLVLIMLKFLKIRVFNKSEFESVCFRVCKTVICDCVNIKNLPKTNKIGKRVGIFLEVEKPN